MKMRKISWIIVAGAIFFIFCGVMAVNIQTCTIANSATVHTPSADIVAYRDEACTQPLNMTDWGHINEGKEYSKTFWVKNEGDDAVSAEWHDDIEEKRPLRYDDSDMRYYNETTGWWEWWSEEWKYPYPKPPPPIPVSSVNVTTTPSNVTITPSSIIRRGSSGPFIEPGEQVKVRYTIEFEISPVQEENIPVPAELCEWNLTLGY